MRSEWDARIGPSGHGKDTGKAECTKIGRFSAVAAAIFLSREGNPNKKPPTPQKLFAQTVCANFVLLVSAYYKVERGDSLYKLFRKCLRKLCFYFHKRHNHP